MIRRLNTQDLNLCTDILVLQFKAYQREAALINFDVPPLLETVEDIRQSSEDYFGFLKDEQLIGGIALEEAEDALDICKLFVDPAHFRQGVARSLLRFCEERGHELGKRRLIVSTGTTNHPAITLYLGFGFEIVGSRVVPGGLEISEFEKMLASEKGS